jgi:ribonuclease-3
LKKEKLTDIKNLFFQKVEIPGLNVSFIGYDETETEAKMQASFKALNYFNKLEMKKEVENPNLENAINQLNILVSKSYIEKPKYIFTKKDSKWECVCLVENQKSTLSVDKSKNLATKKSALKMINQLIDLSVE